MKKENIESLDVNWIKTIHQDWAVLTVNADKKVNGMTVNWIQVGWLWNKHVVSVYVRPQRYTYPFINEEEYFSLAFFDEKHRKELAYLGRVSGSDEDKLKECNFTTSTIDDTPIINEAKMVLTIKKLHETNLEENQFINHDVVSQSYPDRDFHKVIVGEIINVYTNE